MIGFGGALGGIAGGQLATRVSERLGSGDALALTLAAGAVTPALIGLLAWWPAVAVLSG